MSNLIYTIGTWDSIERTGSHAFYEFHSIDYRDDGVNLWLCHGCNKVGGTYYGQNHKGKLFI